MAIGDPNQLPMGMAGPLNLTPQPSYTPPPVPFGYGQMQGMPALSRNPNYGVPSGIGSLLGGQNPMMAPQAGAFLSPQAPVSTNALAGTNPFTGQAFQTFTAGDVTQAASDYRANQAELARQAEEARIAEEARVAEQARQAELLRQAEEKAAAEAAAKAEADRIAAEQAAEAARIAQEQEAARIAAEQAAAAAEAERIAQEQAAAAEAEAKAKADADAAAAAEKKAQEEAAKKAAEEAAAKIASGEVVMPTQEEIAASIRPSTGMGGDKGGPGGVLPVGGVAIAPVEPPMVVEPAVVSTGGISSPVPGIDFIPQVPIDESGIGSLIGVGRPDAAGRGVIPPPPPMITKRNTEEMVGIPMAPVRPSPIRVPDIPALQEPMIPIGVNALGREGSLNIPPPPPPVVRPPMPPPPPVAAPSVARPVVVDAPPPPPLPIRRPPPLPKPPPTPVNVAKKPTPAVIPEIDLDAIRRRVAEIKPEPKVVLPTPRKGRKPITQAIPTRTKEIPDVSTAADKRRAATPKAVTPPKPNTQQVETKPKTRKKQQPKKRRGRRGARGRA